MVSRHPAPSPSPSPSAAPCSTDAVARSEPAVRCRGCDRKPKVCSVALQTGGTTLCPCPVPSMPACCCRCSRSSDLRASLCRVGHCSPLPRDPSRVGAHVCRTPTLAVLEIPHRSPLHRKVLRAAPTLNFWATKSRRWILVRPTTPVWSVRDSISTMISTRALRRTPIPSSAELTFWPPGWRQQHESRRRAGRRCSFQTFVKS